MNVKMAQAMLLSLLIHLLLVLFWVLLQSKVKPKLPQMPIKKSELNLSDFRAYSPPQIAPQPAVATKTIQKQATKSTQKPKPIAKQVQKPTPKPKPITKQVQKPAPKPTQKPAPKPTKPQSSLASALMQQSTPVATQQPRDSKTERMIRSLYGAKFDTFSSAQKRFIKDNLGKIHRITQNTLTLNGYPEVALKTMQQGVNVVVFDLHPNGDISNLRLKQPMGYKLLDDNTLHVIRIAYKNYPKPQSTTTIMFYVEYKIGY